MADGQQFDRLPGHQQAMLVRRLLRVAHQSGMSFLKLTETLRKHLEDNNIDNFDLSKINEENIKKFVARTDHAPIRSSNRLLKGLYDAIRHAKNDLPIFVRENIVLLSDLFLDFQEIESTARNPTTAPATLNEEEAFLTDESDYNFLTAYTYRAICRMLDVRPDHVSQATVSLTGQFILIRPSTKQGRVVLSRLEIREKRVGRVPAEVWEFIHETQDQHGYPRFTDGIVLALRSRVYLLGDIERGRGMDVLCLDINTASEHSPFILGLLLSEDVQGKPITSKVIGVRYDPIAAAKPSSSRTRLAERDETRPGEGRPFVGIQGPMVWGPMSTRDLEIPSSLRRHILEFLAGSTALTLESAIGQTASNVQVAYSTTTPRRKIQRKRKRPRS